VEEDTISLFSNLNERGSGIRVGEVAESEELEVAENDDDATSAECLQNEKEDHEEFAIRAHHPNLMCILLLNHGELCC